VAGLVQWTFREDTGTQLLASSAGTGIRLLVLEGGVRLTGACRAQAAATQLAVRLVRQQQISVPDNHCTSGWSPRTPAQHEIDQQIAWTQDRFYFHGDRLADVADRFNRYNGCGNGAASWWLVPTPSRSRDFAAAQHRLEATSLTA
jgi:ferric-dicitrate binding protein FerR (iron transport regulator)